jgi:hypothetical protein
MEYTEKEKDAWRNYFASVVQGFVARSSEINTKKTIDFASYFADCMLAEDIRKFHKNTVNN